MFYIIEGQVFLVRPSFVSFEKIEMYIGMEKVLTKVNIRRYVFFASSAICFCSSIKVTDVKKKCILLRDDDKDKFAWSSIH